MQKQKTLAASFSLKGEGLYVGLDIEIVFSPIPENHGYKIRRADTEGQSTIDISAENVVNTQRGTVPSKNGVQVSIAGHAIVALYAYEIDNCLVEVNAPESPTLNGGSRFFSKEVQKTGVAEQNAPKSYYIIKYKIETKNEETGSSLIILPDDKFSVSVLISFDSPVFSSQFVTLNDPSKFPTESAASCTLVFVREVEMLLNNNLIKGGDLDNAAVIYDQKIPQESLDKSADMLNIPHKNAQGLDYINNRLLVFDNEPVRHKLIDVIGDITLIGKPIREYVIATRPGYKINNQLARIVCKDIKMSEVQAPVYDPNREPVMDINRIRELLSHRYLFLLVDKIIKVGGGYIVSAKNITTNKPFFQGHFSQESAMLGVLQVEAMVQTGGLLALGPVGESEHYSIYLMKTDGVKFRQEAAPGNTLILRLELSVPIHRGISAMKGYVFVGDKLVNETEFMAQIVKNK